MRIDRIIEEEMVEVADKFGDDRRTELMIGEALSLEDEDLIEEEKVVITISHNGYMKRMPVSDFKTQNRGGRGVKGMGTNDDDFVETILTTSTHDMVLFFTNTGKVYKAKAYEIPEYGRTAKGIPALNFLGIDNQEKIQAVINLDEKLSKGEELFFATKYGTVKRTDGSQFKNIRSNGIIAINLNEGDELISVKLTDGNQNIIIGTKNGYAVSFDEQDVRSMGRTAAGVRGINLREDDYVVGVDILNPDSYVLAISEKGYGKATHASEYAIRRRGGKGIKTFKIVDRNGPLVGLRTILRDEEILLITTEGVMIRFEAEDISITGRDTQGVRLMRLNDDHTVSTLSIINPADEIDESIEENDESTQTKSQDEQDEDNRSQEVDQEE